MTEQPFLPALKPLDAVHTLRFTGQQALAQEIFATWQHQGEHGRSFLALVAPPDSGKSSLLRAGVLPLLSRTEADAKLWRQAIWYPCDDLQYPLRGLATALLGALPELKQTHHLHAEQLANLLRDHSKAAELLLKTTLDLVTNRPLLASAETPVARVALLIENLEQLLLPQFSTQQRALLCERLSQLASSGRCWILASLDEHSLTPLNTCPGFAKLLAGTGQYLLQPPQNEQWQTMLHAGLPPQAMDSGLFSQLLNAVQQQPYPFTAVQAVFALAQKNLNWNAIAGLSGALERLLRMELAGLSAAEQAALRSMLEAFAFTQEGRIFRTRRLPLTLLAPTEAAQTLLKRLLEKNLLWQEKPGDTLWIAAHGTVLHQLDAFSAALTAQPQSAAVAAQVSNSPPAVKPLVAEIARLRRYSPWRPLLLMLLFISLLGAAVVLLPQYQGWLNTQALWLSQQWNALWQDATPPPTQVAEIQAVEPPLTISSPPKQLEPQPQKDLPFHAEAVDAKTEPKPVVPAATPVLSEANQEEKPEPRPMPAPTATDLEQSATAQVKQKQWAKALELYQQATALRQQSHQENPQDADLLRQLSRNYDQIGHLQKRLLRYAAALLSYHEALSASQKLLALAPKDAANQRDLAISHERVGDLHKAQKTYAAAEGSYTDAVKYFKQAAAAEPSASYRRTLAAAYDRLGDVQKLQNNNKAALSSYQSALSIRQSVLQAYPEQRSQQDLLLSHSKITGLWQMQQP